MHIKKRLQLEKRHPQVSPATDELQRELDTAFRRITERAYQLFEQDGWVNGRDLDHWLAAEEQLFRKAPCEIAEKGNEVMVRVEVPGFNERDLKVSVEAERITIWGHKERVVQTESESRARDERDYRDILRALPLPSPVAADGATANLHEGILTVFIPKAVNEKARSAVA